MRMVRWSRVKTTVLCVCFKSKPQTQKDPVALGILRPVLSIILSCFFDVISYLFNLTSFHRMKLPKNFKSKQSEYKSGAMLINRRSNRRSYSAPAWISEFESNPLKWFERDVGTEILVLTSSLNDQKRKCCSQWPYCYPYHFCMSLLFLILVWVWNIQFSPIPGTSLALISCLCNSRLLFKLYPSASSVLLHIAVLSSAVFLLSFPLLLSPPLSAPATLQAMFFMKTTMRTGQITIWCQTWENRWQRTNALF